MTAEDNQAGVDEYGTLDLPCVAIKQSLDKKWAKKIKLCDTDCELLVFLARFFVSHCFLCVLCASVVKKSYRLVLCALTGFNPLRNSSQVCFGVSDTVTLPSGPEEVAPQFDTGLPISKHCEPSCLCVFVVKRKFTARPHANSEPANP